MLCAKPHRTLGFAVLGVVCGALIAFGGINEARAQEPPTTIPAGGLLAYDPNAIAFNSWLLYPTINFLAENSNNFFITPQNKLSGWLYGIAPSMTAEWSNGIHTTTLYGNFQQLQYPPDNAVPQQSNITAPTGQGTWTQQYAPLRDLNFTVVGDYIHQTLQAGLTNSVPTPTQFTGITVLPNGDFVLPNGIIISPTGQLIGQIGPAPTVGVVSFVNPYDQFTGTGRVQKIFEDGIVTLGASVQRVDYEHQGTPDYTNKTFTEGASFWLGPVFYLYSEGSFNARTTDPNLNSTAYRFVGGIGTRQVGLFRASMYFGHQGSGSSGSSSAGGNVYGGTVSYYPTPALTISANVDETINLAPLGAPPSTQALGIAGITPLQIPLSSATQTTSTALHATYIINPQWTVSGLFGFVHIENIGSPIWDDSYVTDTSISYQMWRNLSLKWDYQYSSIVSNAPQTSVNRNLITMSATYRF